MGFTTRFKHALTKTWSRSRPPPPHPARKGKGSSARCFTKLFSFPLSLPTILTLIPLFCVFCVNSSPLPIKILDGIKQAGAEKLDAEATGMQKLKPAGGGPGILKKGVLGIQTKVLNNVPATNELVKSKGIVDKATGTGSVLTDDEKKKRKKKKKEGDTPDSSSPPPPSSTPKNEEEKEESHEPKGGGFLTRGLAQLAEIGSSGGKEIKLVPMPGT